MDNRLLTREDWIRELELTCIELAAQGLNYEHVYSEMESLTNKFLEIGNSVDIAVEIPLLESGDDSVTDYVKSIEQCEDFNIFKSLSVKDSIVVYVKDLDEGKKVVIKLLSLSKSYNYYNNVKRIYSSTRNNTMVKFTRVA